MRKGCSAKNCMDTRGGRGREGDRGEGGLCCCNVAQSVCHRRAHHGMSQSVCQSVWWGVADAHASVFMALGMLVSVPVCMCSTRDFILSECGEIRPHPHQICHSRVHMPPWASMGVISE